MAREPRTSFDRSKPASLCPQCLYLSNRVADSTCWACDYTPVKLIGVLMPTVRTTSQTPLPQA